jgi:AraC family cel operon transcriptional repressor
MTFYYANVMSTRILKWRHIAPGAAFHAARSLNTHANPLPYHGHDFGEVFWIDFGEGTHRLNGQRLPLRTGDLIFIRPGDEHGIDVPRGGEVRLTNIAFPADALDLLPRYFPAKTNPLGPAAGRLPGQRHIEPMQRHRFNQWADELSVSSREPLYRDRFLLNLLGDLFGQPQDAALSEGPLWLRQACQAIRSPERFSRGVGEFLKLCGRSREHVARTVQQHFHTTPTDYVNAIRMEHARRRLEMGADGIVDIALECGTENLSHFYDLFRRHTGQTPRQYRQTHRRTV